jgi:hypothetical protein
MGAGPLTTPLPYRSPASSSQPVGCFDSIVGGGRIPHVVSSGNLARGAAASRIVEGLRAEHGDEDGQEPIADAPQGAAMAAAAGAEPGVEGGADEIVLDRRLGPVVEGVAQPRIARVAHRHQAPSATFLGDRSAADVASRAAKSREASASIVALTFLPTPGKDRRMATSRCSCVCARSSRSCSLRAA